MGIWEFDKMSKDISGKRYAVPLWRCLIFDVQRRRPATASPLHSAWRKPRQALGHSGYGGGAIQIIFDAEDAMA